MVRLRLVLVTLLLLAAAGSVHGQQTFLQQSVLAANTDFAARVNVAVVAVSYTISLEDGAGGGQCVGRDIRCPTLRKQLATFVANDPTHWGSQFVLAVVSDTTITSAATDQNLKDRIYQVWNLMAGS